MTKKQKTKLIEDLKALLRSKGFEEDRFGHFKRARLHPVPGRGMQEVRYRFNDLALRREVKTSYGDWVRIRSGYYKDLSITEDGKIAGMTA